MLKFALLGYGRMGKEVEAIAKIKGHEVTAVFDIQRRLQAETSVTDIDVFIDFSEPGAVLDNVKLVARLGKPMVIGTTGWSQHLREVEGIFKDAGLGVLHAANFSIGMNLFSRIVSHTASLFDRFDEYDIFLQETHHRGKLDSPSGTALSLAQIVLDNVARKTDLLCTTPDEKISAGQLHVTSTRGGNMPGTHVVAFDSNSDTIELKHTARDRGGFASGAILAAEWLIGKQGFFNMNDLLNDLIASSSRRKDSEANQRKRE